MAAAWSSVGTHTFAYRETVAFLRKPLYNVCVGLANKGSPSLLWEQGGYVGWNATPVKQVSPTSPARPRP